MAEGLARGSRAWLTLQWRNAMALLVAAVFLGGVGSIILLVAQVPLAEGGLLGVFIVTIAATFAAYSAYLLNVVAKGEAQLRQVGSPWRADRNIAGTTRRFLLTDATPERSLVVAGDVLSQPRFGLTRVGKSLFGGICAIRPAETGPIVVSVVPLAIRVVARKHRAQTRISVSIVQSSIYGWPVLSGWMGWSAQYTWIQVAQDLATELVSALAEGLKGRVE